MTTIKLPDGREINLKDLTNQVTNRTNHNLKTRKTTRRRHFQPIKYTVEDRIWLATNCLDDIMVKYQVSPTVAQSLKYQSRYILEKLEVDYKRKE